MTLDEAIKHLDESLADPGHDWGCEECKGEHEQLLEWLRELKELRELYSAQTEGIGFLESDNKQLDERLKEAKRLLKAAVEDFKEINSDILTCKYCKWYSAENDECTFIPDDTPCEKICGWKHEGEALALIGEEGENNV